MTTLAAIRENDDLDELALDFVDRWVCCVEGSEQVDALIFKGLAFFCFNRMPEAVQVAEKALDVAGILEDADRARLSQRNLAHYLAEMGGESDSVGARKARELMGKVVSGVGGEKALLPSERDTLGHVKIVFAESHEELLEGQRLCKQAFDESPEDLRHVARAFFELHDEIARDKLKRWGA